MSKKFVLDNSLIIHPNDPSTRFLKKLYNGYGSPIVITEKDNNKVIKEVLTDKIGRAHV